jgi:His/Glu/Gln/Arg/opine family amino acid ABC transporter permease subunit
MSWIPLLSRATLTTVVLFVAVALSATIFGIGLAVALDGPLRAPARTYSWVLRGIPPIMVLFIVFFGLPTIGLSIPSFAAAWLGMTAYALAYMGEIIRAGLKSIPTGVRDATRALGLPYRKALVRIFLPQAVGVILPPYVNELTELLKDTAIASVVGVTELANAATTITSQTYQPLQVFGVAAIIYGLLNSVLLSAQERAGRGLWRAGR